MTQRESGLSRRIINALREEHGKQIFCWKVWGGDVQMAGLPDIVGVVAGRFFGIETKLPESRDNVSPKQAYVHGLIGAAGGRVKVCCSVTESKAFIQSIMELAGCFDVPDL